MEKGQVDFPFGPIPHWVSVKDRLPEINQEVLSWCENVRGHAYPAGFKYYALDKYLECGFRTDMIYGKVLYWLPLPTPPKDES